MRPAGEDSSLTRGGVESLFNIVETLTGNGWTLPHFWPRFRRVPFRIKPE